MLVTKNPFSPQKTVFLKVGNSGVFLGRKQGFSSKEHGFSEKNRIFARQCCKVDNEIPGG